MDGQTDGKTKRSLWCSALLALQKRFTDTYMSAIFSLLLPPSESDPSLEEMIALETTFLRCLAVSPSSSILDFFFRSFFLRFLERGSPLSSSESSPPPTPPLSFLDLKKFIQYGIMTISFDQY